jgi:hypothetical protein
MIIDQGSFALSFYTPQVYFHDIPDEVIENLVCAHLLYFHAFYNSSSQNNCWITITSFNILIFVMLLCH